MSAIVIAVQALLSKPAVTALVDQRIWPKEAPQGQTPPWIIVYRGGSEEDEELLGGASQFLETRVSIESVALSYADADRIGETVISSLRNVHLASIAGHVVSIRKAGTDVDDSSDDRSTFRRVTDFYLRWR